MMFTKKRNVFSRFIAILMIISVTSTGLPASVFASEQSGLAETNVTPVDNTNTDSTPPKEKKILKELVDKREANVKHFLMDDMSEEADVYSSPVHYQDNGQWKDIDNSMVSVTDDTVGNSYSNKSNDFKINIAKDTAANKLVKIKKGKYEVSWNVENAQSSSAKVINDNPIQATLSDEEKKKTVKNLSSNVSFPDVFQDVDLNYNIDANNLKENIIIKKATDINSFTFNLSAKNVLPQLLKDNSIAFYDKKEKSNVFTFKSPIMYDANGNISKDISVELSKIGNDYSLTIIPNQEWLKDSNRVFPITIDPTITTLPTTFECGFVKKGSPDTIFDAQTLEVGNSTNGQEMSYLQFKLPDLSASDVVTSSILKLEAVSSTNTIQINLYKVIENWTKTSLTYNNRPKTTFDSDSVAEDYARLGPDNLGNDYWDITRLTKDWYVNGNNYGVLLKSIMDSTAGSGLAKFISTTGTPCITIQYINSSGLESYWSYHSSNVGRAGTIYTNDYNGNVTAVHDDVSLSGNRMPISLKHVFNTNNEDIGYGYGWRLNYDQTLIKTTIDGAPNNTTYYAYTDQDGTVHYFQSGTSKDDSGLGLKFKINTDKTYTITDKNYNTWNFSPEGKLTSMTDSVLKKWVVPPSFDDYVNILKIEYNPYGKIKSISDGSGRAVVLTYYPEDATGHLQSITDYYNKTISFTYNDSNQLISIKYPDNKISTYQYNSDNTLSSVTNYDGHKVTIEYYNQGNIQRAKNVQETGSNEDATIAEGQGYTIIYGDNVTNFVDAKQRTQTYQFNNSGNTTNIQNDDGSGYFFKYDTSTGALPNKLVTQSKLQSTITNLMKDPSIERNTGSDWVGGIFGSDPTKETATINTGTTYSHYGIKSLKLTNNDGDRGPYFDQYVELSPGKTYTLSAFVKTVNVSNANHYGAELNVYYPSSSGLNSKSSNFVNGSTDWQRFFLTFSLPNDAASNTVIIEPILFSETGTAYFDDFQLEEGEICNRYNIIENGDFSSYDGSNNPNDWIRGATCTNNDKVTTDSGKHPGMLDNNVLTIVGDVTKAKSFSKELNLHCNAGDILVIGCWAKADSAPIKGSSTRRFGIEVQFDSLSDTEKLDFNPGCKDWQYITGVITAKFCSRVTIKLKYYDNINSASFDGLQLYKESYGKSYAYDDNGNLTSVVDLANQNRRFIYTDNDLTGYIDGNGNNFNYTIDDRTHNVGTSTSAAGVHQRFEYDPYGNTTKIVEGSSSCTTHTYTSATYTDSGNYVSTITDPLGSTVSKRYNENNGNLDAVKDAKNNSINYLYDTLGRVTNTKSTNTDSTNNTNDSYTYENDRLKTLSANGVTYNFGYDPLGHNNSVSVGTQNLITNNYENTTGNLLSSTYGNGQTSAQDYDTLNRIVNQKYSENCLFHYEYDDSGNLAYLQDIENGVNYNFIYDFANRLVLVKDSNGNSTSYTYDKNNNVSTMIDTVGWNSSTSTSNVPYTTSYSYDGDSRIKSVTTPATPASPNGVIVTTAYDTLGLGRIVSKEINNLYTTTYTYTPGSGATSGGTSKVIASITNGGKTLSYTYDENENIRTIYDGTNIITYSYNALNELIREDNQVLNKTVVYTYDKGGNIQNKVQYPYTTGTLGTATSTITYSYGDTNWKDKLSLYNGKNITYDAIGNPLTYNGYTYTWDRGKELASINGNGLAVSYKYNSNGIRMQKTVNGVNTTYHLVGDKATFENNGTDKIYYTYDSNGKLVSMNLNGTEYFYIRNAQSDIIGLVDKTGALVASYVYDTWGKLVSITDTSGVGVGTKNPYRYRGYRYDTESGLYYCNSRYYNPDWGRFLNADGEAGNVGALLSHNMFAYCQNNPVNMVDPNGNNPLIGLAIGGLVGGGAAAIISYHDTGSINWDKVRDWGINGALIGSGLGELAGARMVMASTAGKLDAINISSKQLGKKWGEHMGDYPNLSSYKEYQGLVNDIFNNAEKILYDERAGEYYYLKGQDLLRVKENGDFVSLYPGADGSRVTNLEP